MMQTGPREGEVRAANEIFTLLPEGHDLAVIIDALAGRNGLSDKARSELSSRIRKLRIKGFRDANRAPHDRLVETILDTIAGGDHGLAAAILGTWMQTHSALRERAAAHLRGRGIDVVDAPPVRFTSCWDTDEWLLERNRMLQDSDGAYAHRDDAALMLSLVSGRFPGPPPVESELFKAWIDTLWELPASAPEWPADAANLGKWIRYILREKERGIIEGVVHKIADQWNGIENEFNDDLHYLGIGPITLQAPPGGPELLIGTLEFLTALRVQLEAYRPLRPQAASRQEEIERSEARRAAEEGILKLTAEWQDRMARARQAQEAATAAQRAEPAVDEEEPPTGKEADGDPAAIEALTAERDRLQAELNTLREENGRLGSSNEELRAESGRRDDETSKLNDLVARSRRTEEQWRQVYVESRKGRRPDDTPVSIDSVGEAVALAREAFPDRLLIKLNSRSNENTPFTNPAEVYDALAWLATAHCDANDNRIGETCTGWTYKTSQREESIAKYREWYETLADGKTWYLGAHIGKGTSRDPRHTIRIGFVRDEEDNRVIVGFIGLHQRNRQS